jgi:hypothetical protein
MKNEPEKLGQAVLNLVNKGFKVGVYKWGKMLYFELTAKEDDAGVIESFCIDPEKHFDEQFKAIVQSLNKR